MSYTKGELYIDKDYWGENDTREFAIMLPHSCDEWIIGGKEEALQLLADLQTLIPKLTEAESIDA